MSKQPSDFNDLKKTKGLSVVKKQVDAALDAEKGTPYGPFRVTPRGVFWVHREDEEPSFFCSSLVPVGVARTTKGKDFSFVFRMIDLDKKTKTFLLSFESLHRAGGEEARLEFARRGGYFGQGIRTRQCFADFCNAIAARSKHLPRVTLAKTPGWLRLANGTYVYVLPDVTIGQAAEQVILEHAEDAGEEYGTSGTAEEWRNRVGRFCIENTRLLLAASVPFTSPLLDVMKEEGGGLNLLGTSSVGKSAMLRVAGSVLGGPQSVKTMDATATGLELAATLVNDSTLLLDELGAGKADEVGQAIYRLANGISKARGTSNVGLRAQRSWRVLFLTNGERDLKSLVTEAGKRFFAGQEVRHPNIEAEVSKESGIYNQFHGLADGAKLTAHLRAECQACFGSPFREFLKRLVEDRNRDLDGLVERLKAIIERFKAQAIPQGADGQVIRVASRFGLIAAGGELATEYGITGWPVDEAFNGVLVCFKTWLERRGTIGKTEVETLIQQVESFFELHGESRFAPMEAEAIRGPARPVINRVGFRKVTVSAVTNDSVTDYYVLTVGFREMTAGFDLKWAAAILAERGLIRVGSSGKHSVSVRLPGMGPTRCYHFPARDAGEPDQEQERAGREELPVIDLDAAG